MNGAMPTINNILKLVAEAKEHEKNGRYDRAGEKYQEAAGFFKNIGETKLQAKCQAAHAVNMIKYYLEERDIESFAVNLVESFTEEIDGIKDIELEKIDKYDILITAYRELEKVFHDVNNIDKEIDLYYKRMELYHKYHWGKLKQMDEDCTDRAKILTGFIFHGFLHHFYRHGRKPLLPLLWISLTVTSFAFLYKYFGLIAFNPPDKTVCIWQSLYFSVVTFTTLGFGDIVPTCLFGQLLVILEVTLGIITIASLIPLILKKLE